MRGAIRIRSTHTRPIRFSLIPAWARSNSATRSPVARAQRCCHLCRVWPVLHIQPGADVKGPLGRDLGSQPQYVPPQKRSPSVVGQFDRQRKETAVKSESVDYDPIGCQIGVAAIGVLTKADLILPAVVIKRRFLIQRRAGCGGGDAGRRHAHPPQGRAPGPIAPRQTVDGVAGRLSGGQPFVAVGKEPVDLAPFGARLRPGAAQQCLIRSANSQPLPPAARRARFPGPECSCPPAHPFPQPPAAPPFSARIFATNPSRRVFFASAVKGLSLSARTDKVTTRPFTTRSARQ